jgi:hypothetical protein
MQAMDRKDAARAANSCFEINYGRRNIEILTQISKESTIALKEEVSTTCSLRCVRNTR